MSCLPHIRQKSPSPWSPYTSDSSGINLILLGTLHYYIYKYKEYCVVTQAGSKGKVFQACRPITLHEKSKYAFNKRVLSCSKVFYRIIRYHQVNGSVKMLKITTKTMVDIYCPCFMDRYFEHHRPCFGMLHAESIAVTEILDGKLKWRIMK